VKWLTNEKSISGQTKRKLLTTPDAHPDGLTNL